MQSGPLDFRKFLGDAIKGSKLDREQGALIRSCRSWLEKNEDAWKTAALYDIEGLACPEEFLRLNYFGSLKFSTQESWKQAFIGWLRWLKDQHPEGDIAKENIRGNISILEAAYSDPTILAHRPYTFLGWGTSARVRVFFEKPDSFFIDYHYSIVPDWRETGANARYGYDLLFGDDPGVMFIKNIKKRRFFRETVDRQQTVHGGLSWNPYRSLEPESFFAVLDEVGFPKNHSEDVGDIWKPQIWVPPHDKLEPQFESQEETQDRHFRELGLLFKEKKGGEGQLPSQRKSLSMRALTRLITWKH